MKINKGFKFRFASNSATRSTINARTPSTVAGFSATSTKTVDSSAKRKTSTSLSRTINASSSTRRRSAAALILCAPQTKPTFVSTQLLYLLFFYTKFLLIDRPSFLLLLKKNIFVK